MRLFIAIELSNEMRRELADISKALRERSCGGRFVPAENMHVTMRFLGETNELAAAVDAMRESCRGIRPFELRLGKYGFFDKNCSGGVTSVVHVEGDLDELNVLHQTLESALADRGFPRDMKRFRPHITLGRSVQHDELVTSELQSMPIGASVTVNGLTLYESTRVRGNMVYTPLHRQRF